MVSIYLPRVFEDSADEDARTNMILASTYAGIGFGNAGVHLCHGMSYPIAGMVKNYTHPGYKADHPIIPHGISVVVNAPAVFRFTSSSNSDRHLKAAHLMGADTHNIKDNDSGKLLSDQLIKIMKRLKVPNGLTALGYNESDIPKLVEGTLPQQRVLKLSPKPVGIPELTYLFKEAMTIY